ncbi:MAG: tripartite tricarboxylate transporter substrate binding protein BugE [Comamonas sp.]|jgi:tripartite-type tricarboxylate transporter receptor subunit TctC
MQRRSILGLSLIAAAAVTASAGAFADTKYPTKPIRLIVPFAAGGTTDIIARVIADPLGKELGQVVVVDNKGGAGGTIGAVETVRAAPDGYTLGIATVSTVATNPAINPKISYDPIKDFTPIINVAATPNIIAVNPKFPAKDYKAFEAELKANANKYSYSSSGTGGIQHMLMELYKSLTGIQMTHIAYRGAGPALNDTVAGQVNMILDNLPSTLPFVKDNRLIPIVVAAPERLAVLPNVPTFKEMGLEPVNRMAFYGILGPKDMPKEIVDKINAATKKVLADPAVKKRIEDTGSLVVGNTPAQFAEQIKAEYDVYKDVVKKQNLKLD